MACIPSPALISARADTPTSRDRVDAAIARIERLDGPINAVVVRDFNRARAAATLADKRIAAGERARLLGLPITVKEQFNVTGLPTTWGDPRSQDWRPSYDALVIQRLKAAGAIILGKTNVPFHLQDLQSFNAVYGSTSNPWDVTRTCGGSSGGSAAALAAGFTTLELGSDIGGSLRAPAHFCGVFAHKPSLDLVPLRGSGPPRSLDIPWQGDLAVIGPMARTAADLQLMLDVIAGPDELRNGIGYRLALPPPRRERLADYRVLALTIHPLCPTGAAVSGAIDTLATRLAAAGCAVRRTVPSLPDLALTTRVYVELLAAAYDAERTPEERLRLGEYLAGLAPEDTSLDTAAARGAVMGHAAWQQTTYIRNRLQAQWQALFEDIDVLICPPMPTVAFPKDQSPGLGRRLDVDGRSIVYWDQHAWSAIATLNGLPATVAPLGRTAAGLPTGVQIIGGYLSDRTTIAFAGLIEQAFGGFVPPPGFA